MELELSKLDDFRVRLGTCWPSAVLDDAVGISLLLGENDASLSCLLSSSMKSSDDIDIACLVRLAARSPPVARPASIVPLKLPHVRYELADLAHHDEELPVVHEELTMVYVELLVVYVEQSRSLQRYNHRV